MKRRLFITMKQINTNNKLGLTFTYQTQFPNNNQTSNPVTALLMSKFIIAPQFFLQVRT